MQAPAQDNKSFEPAPVGNHVARMYRIINIGTVEEEYMGEVKQLNKILLTFELCNEKKEFKEGEGERPISVSREFTFSMGPKANLRKFIEGMLGTAMKDDEANLLDVETLLGKACLLNVVHKVSGAGKTYALIQNASPLPKGMDAPAQVNPNFILGYGETWDVEKFKKLSKFIQEKMVKSAQYKELNIPVVQLSEYKPDGINPDDIPF